MANYVLFVFEGKKTEVQIFSNLKKYFLNESTNTNLIAVYCQTIYNLYQELDNDSDLDLFTIIKEKIVDKYKLQYISSKNVSEIYLFFDYDGHAPNASQSKLENMLTLFNEETELGKLYISYPMVEARV